MIGPSPVFLRYIERVLPALGESGTVMRTPGSLYPGVDAARHERHDVARLKGDARMAHVVARAVERRQRVPAAPVELDVDGTRVIVRPEAFARARSKARATGHPHNRARTTFVRSMLDHLTDQLARVQGIDLRIDPETRIDLQVDLRDSIDVRRAVNLAWMPLTPERLLAEMLTDEAVLAEVAPEFTVQERSVLLRQSHVADDWSIEDVPLLDELAELLGDDDTAERAAAAVADAQRRQDLETARSALRATGGDAARMVSAEMLVDRFADTGPRLSVAEHADRDRTWTFGHVVVDEAQELSAMQWRVIVRRCPSRSMTVVGDVAQTGSAAGTRDWASAMESIAPGRWRTEELTVNYRTPRRVIELAASTAREHGLEVAPQRTVREGDRDPLIVTAKHFSDVVGAVLEEHARLGEGRMAVIAPPIHPTWGVMELRAALGAALGDEVGDGDTALDHAVAVLDPTASKGLEVDVVVVVDPGSIRAAGGPFGAGDVFVAMTRPTRALVVVEAASEAGAQ
jgi:DNA helicase IV